MLRNAVKTNRNLYLGQYENFPQSLPQNADSAFLIFYRGLANFFNKNWPLAAEDFDRAYQLDASLLPVRRETGFNRLLKVAQGRYETFKSSFF